MLAELAGEIEPPDVHVTPAGAINVDVVRPAGNASVEQRCAAVDRIAAAFAVPTKAIPTQTKYFASGNGVIVITTTAPLCAACGAVRKP